MTLGNAVGTAILATALFGGWGALFTQFYTTQRSKGQRLKINDIATLFGLWLLAAAIVIAAVQNLE